MSDQKKASQNKPEASAKPVKSAHAEREERILAQWKEKGTFEKTLAKDSPKGEFVFYEGPPTANGRPGIHHLEARAFKDAVPRYKTMQGYHVRRKGGWDTHGLPVELAVEKQLNLASKKDIEKYGIAAFNEKCKESVWTYVHEWEDFTGRMGYWIDLKDPYITYKPNYIESVWNIIKETDKQGLLYKDYRVVPWCPKDGTVLSSHELAQGYEMDKDLTLIAKFELVDEPNTFFLAWTTTPWTLPGNVALAVGPEIEYIKAKTDQGIFILAKERAAAVLKDMKHEVVTTVKGSELVGKSYKFLYPFEKDNLKGDEKDKLANAFKVYAADFVTTTDGTGIVHIAPMYGQDDFELGTRMNLPKYHLVNEDGTFKSEAGFLAGKFVKSEEVAVEIIKDLANRPSGSLLFHKEKHEHSYPHCWRCHTPLIYFARDSWYIRMSELRSKLVRENEGIHWEPDYIKEGRFGEWLKDVKDWAISRERYWGTPLPVWNCEKCQKRQVVGSVDEIKGKPKNTYFVMRHGEAESNLKHILSCHVDNPHNLTEKGKTQAKKGAEVLKGRGIDVIIASDFLRTKQTAEIVADTLGIPKDKIIYDPHIREFNSGDYNLKDISDYHRFIGSFLEGFTKTPPNGENYTDVKKRVGDFLYETDSKYSGKTILIISHETPMWCMQSVASGLDPEASVRVHGERDDYIDNGEVLPLDFRAIPHNPEYELDLHRPFIDEVTLTCDCGGTMKRVKEVMDVWLDSGSMPFAQEHYPFEAGSKKQEAGSKAHSPFSLLLSPFSSAKQKLPYPADFISEAIDQTRGWFYTLHAVGALMGKGKAYKNVICLGHVLDAQGKKMSKHIGNVVNPFDMMDKYGADALRFWMYSINQPGEPKNFDEKTVDEVNKKVFNLAANVASFYKMYEDKDASGRVGEAQVESQNILDRWILARLNQMVEIVTTNMDKYVFLESSRSIRDFIADLSQWYLRRSRDRFKGDDVNDKKAALATTRFVLLTLSKVMAPFTPFFAEFLYQEVGGLLESVHLENWPKAGKIDSNLVKAMETVRDLSSKGFEARMAAKINVRQPLAKLRVQTGKMAGLDSNALQIIKDEINVKEIESTDLRDKEVELDTTITPELKEEGDLRELVRQIQDMRKEMGLSVGDMAALILPGDKKPLANKYESHIKKTTSLSSIEFGEVGQELSLKRL